MAANQVSVEQLQRRPFRQIKQKTEIRIWVHSQTN